MSNKMIPIFGKAKEMALGCSCAKKYGKIYFQEIRPA